MISKGLGRPHGFGTRPMIQLLCPIGTFIVLNGNDQSMSEVLRPIDLEGLSIIARKFEAGTLMLVPEGGEEISLVCVCDRSHWLVTTREQDERIILTLVCHNCRRRYDFPYTGPIP